MRQRFAAGYRTMHELFRQGQIPDSNLKNLVAELEGLWRDTCEAQLCKV